MRTYRITTQEKARAEHVVNNAGVTQKRAATREARERAEDSSTPTVRVNVYLVEIVPKARGGTKEVKTLIYQAVKDPKNRNKVIGEEL